MDGAAVTAAEASLQRAAASIVATKNAANWEAVEGAWTDFLNASHRIFGKLEQGAKTAAPSKTWFGKKVHERRTDPLLCYIHHARNADEHGLEKTTERKGGGLEIRAKDGSSGLFIEKMTISSSPSGGQITYKGDPAVFAFVPSHVQLLPVMDRGVRYEQPSDHLGKTLPKAEALAAAEMALPYLTNLVAEAKQL